jgi:hypothetical protein
MTQRELNRAVARATGETIETIQRVGFLLADPVVDPVVDRANPDDDQFGPYVLDWDELHARRPDLVH